MGLLKLLWKGPPVAETGGSSCGSTVLSLLRLHLMLSLLWLSAA